MHTSASAIVGDLIHAHGPLDDRALLTLARKAGAAGLSAAELADILHSGQLPTVTSLPDDRYVDTARLLADHVFTYRLTSLDVVHDVLSLSADLAALEPLVAAESPLLALPGGPVSYLADADDERWTDLADAIADDDPEDVQAAAPHSELYASRPDDIDMEAMIALPPGTLADFEAGDLVGIRPATGGLVIESVAPGAVPADWAGRVDAALRDWDAHAADRGRPRRREPTAGAVMPLNAGRLVHTLIAGDAALWRTPLPPLSEMLTSAGFAVIGDADVSTGDVDPRQWEITTRAADLALIHDIPVDGALAIAQIAPWVWWNADVLLAEGSPVPEVNVAPPLPDTPDGIALLTASLAAPDVAEALLAEALGSEVDSAPVLAAMTETWEAQAPPRARVALRWMRSRCAERLGLVEEAEAHLAAARALDDSWAPVLRDLARYASDRGDATGAISLLQRAGAPGDDPELAFLQSLTSPPRSGLGRNQPCWCGSGRKYKMCHLGQEDLPLTDRARWLYRKAFQYLESGPGRYLVADLARLRARYDTDPRSLLRRLGDPLVIHAALFLGDSGLGFLEERGHLLPADERAVFEQWLLQDWSVYEVIRVRVGSGITVRDIRTGDTVDVGERTASRQLRAGQRVLMHLLPIGEVWQIFGGVEILPPHLEKRAIDLCDALADGGAGPLELVGLVTSRHAPPTVQTTDGKPLVQCTGSFRVTDPTAVRDALASVFHAHDDDEFAWLADESDHPTVFAHLRLDGDTLTVDTMNEERWSMVRDLLADVDGLEFVGVTRTAAADLLKQAAAGPGLLGGPAVDEVPDSPELRAALDDYARTHERRWLDESVPALGGLTPRQAVADPTRRDDVIRLLDYYDAQPAAGLMDTGRLRAALDL